MNAAEIREKYAIDVGPSDDVLELVRVETGGGRDNPAIEFRNQDIYRAFPELSKLPYRKAKTEAVRLFKSAAKVMEKPGTEVTRSGTLTTYWIECKGRKSNTMQVHSLPKERNRDHLQRILQVMAV